MTAPLPPCRSPLSDDAVAWAAEQAAMIEDERQKPRKTLAEFRAEVERRLKEDRPA